MSSISAAAHPGGFEGKLNRANAFFDLPVSLRSRLLVVLGALLLIPTFLFPLYNMTLYSNQFPDGLNLYIYSYTSTEVIRRAAMTCVRSTRSTTTSV